MLLIITGLLVVAKAEDMLEEAEPLEEPPTVPYDAEDEDEMPEDRPGEQVLNSVKWSAPNLSDEEQHSTRLPTSLKCDGCTAIAYQIGLIVSSYHKHKYDKKGKMAPESEVIELFEKICSKPTFDNYGLKTYNGENRLSGPGTDAVDEPGMMQGGGRWPYRLFSMCGEIVGELDEYELYQYITENGIEDLKSYLCDNTEITELNSCAGVPNTRTGKVEL